MYVMTNETDTFLGACATKTVAPWWTIAYNLK